ncbi:VOC family protein [Ilumatobacter sp.]|uniref:VOC family protein n=1 Tax=Ilumatobacter sp. TaxID=1967498 RepID=UPI003B52609D
MIDDQAMFHVGVRVPDLAAAMDELGATLGLIWAEPRENPAQTLWTPDGGTADIHLRYTYSARGPQHVELLEGPPGTFWDGRDVPGAHHVGMWVDDVDGETARLVADGWALVGAQQDPDAEGGHGVFTYLRPPSGLIVELVDRAVEPHFETWWSAALAD